MHRLKDLQGTQNSSSNYDKLAGIKETHYEDVPGEQDPGPYESPVPALRPRLSKEVRKEHCAVSSKPCIAIACTLIVF